MAKKQTGPIKSDAIREYLAANPKAGGKEVVAALGEKGMKVNPSLVYFVKGKLKGSKQRKARVVRAARAASSTGTPADAVTLIREIKALAAKSGGIEKLKALVEALTE